MLYFRVNYATHWELVRFCENKNIVKFLIDEVNDENTYLARNSALRLLKYINKYFIYEDELISIVSDLLEKDEDENIISMCLDIVTKTKLLEEKKVREVIEKYKNSDSDLILVSVLKLINTYDFLDDYVSCILFSLESALHSFVGFSDNGKVHLIDLDITLKEVIRKIKTENSILTLLNWFAENQRNIHRDTFTGEILDHLILASVVLFNDGSRTIYDKVYHFFSGIYIDLYGKEYLRFLEFFIQTKTYLNLIDSILTWNGDNHIEFQKIDILYQLMKGSLFDEIFNVIYQKFVNNDEIVKRNSTPLTSFSDFSKN